MMGTLAAAAAAALSSGAIPIRDEYKWVAPLLVPVLFYAASRLPKPGDEDLLDLADKLGKREAEGVLRQYLHIKAQMGLLIDDDDQVMPEVEDALRGVVSRRQMPTAQLEQIKKNTEEIAENTEPVIPAGYKLVPDKKKKKTSA
jgi:hypothetical protein